MARPLWRDRTLTYAGFLGLALLIYWPCLRGEFLSWDDTQHILLNPWLQAGDVARFWRAPYYGLFVPVIYTLWTALYQIAASATAFHLFNLCLHALNATLVAGLARRGGLKAVAALAAGAIVLLHPLQVEAVAWISGGRDVLAATFALLALTVLPSVSGAIVFFALSVLAKPAWLVLPVVIWLWREPLGLTRGRAAVLVAAQGLVAVFASVALMREQTSWIAPRLALTPLARVPVALDTLGFYITKWIWPWPLSADYGRTPGEVLAHAPTLALGLGAIALVILGVAFARAGERRRPVLLLLFSALLLSLPVSGLVPFAAQLISTPFDRYLHPAMVPLALGLAPLAATRWRLGVVVVLVSWAVVSFVRSEDFSSSRALAEATLSVNPRSGRALVNLANEELAAGQRASAKAHLLEALALDSESALVLANLAYIYWLEHDLASLEREIAPPLTRLEFLQSNAHETAALALMFRMHARTRQALRDTPSARHAYCEALKLDAANRELAEEARLFAQDTGTSCP